MKHAVLEGQESPPVLDGLRPEGFRHCLMPYAGVEEFVATAGAFLREGVARRERALVVVPAVRIDALRRELGRSSDDVQFEDMARVGLNPARIIPVWRDFVERNAATGRRLRGIGEPIHLDRDAAELAECQLHEALLNVAFPEDPDLTLLCPYDTAALPAPVIEEAFRSHPAVHAHGSESPSWTYLDGNAQDRLAASDLPAHATPSSSLEFVSVDDLGAVRTMVREAATDFGLDDVRTDALALVVHEAAANSIVHGGGAGRVSCWQEKGILVVEVEDRGTFALAQKPLVGRVKPELEQDRGRGLWLANQLADLVQLRTTPHGTTVRVAMRRESR